MTFDAGILERLVGTRSLSSELRKKASSFRESFAFTKIFNIRDWLDVNEILAEIYTDKAL